MKEALIQRFGEHRVSDIPVADGDVPLLMLDLELKAPVSVLVTNGLSDYEMPVPEKEMGNEFNEIFFCLPSYWEWEDMENANTNWVFHWIQRLAKYVQEKETWFGHGHTMPCGKEKQELSALMKENHFMLMRPLLLEQEMAPIMTDGKEVQFLSIVPIFENELDYKLGKGTRKLVTRFINKGVSEKLDDFRPSVMTRKWKFIR